MAEKSSNQGQTMISLENLLKLREAAFNTLTNLEMGLLAEQKKADEYDFFANDPQYDRQAMKDQALRSLDNVKNIKLVLEQEKNNLKMLELEIEKANKLLSQHGSHPCLMGLVPHAWKILAYRAPGKFSRRVCTVCQTLERIGDN